MPVYYFVFKKNKDHFSSNILFTVVISNSEDKVQVYRESWIENIKKSYYEDTRSNDNNFTTQRNISILPGNYKLFLNIQDKDSRRNWQINKDYKLDRIEILGPMLSYIYIQDSKKTIAANILKQIDTLWVRTQLNIPKNKDKQIHYKISQKETIIDTGLIRILEKEKDNMYYLPVPITQHKSGRYDVTFSYDEEEKMPSFL